MHKTSRTKRGIKAKLPPRVPAARRLPRLSGIDFATKEVLNALGFTEIGLSDPDESDAEIFKSVTIPHQVNKHIREVVSNYCADVEFAHEPKDFRLNLESFGHALSVFLKKFPELNSVLSEALDHELKRQHDEGRRDTEEKFEELNGALVENMSAEPDLAAVRDLLETLNNAVEHVRSAEKGPGRDGDRAKHLLIEGLSCIFKDCTKKKPSAGWNEGGGDDGFRSPFGNFVRAVNASIPDPFKICGLETLFRSMD